MRRGLAPLVVAVLASLLAVAPVGGASSGWLDRSFAANGTSWLIDSDCDAFHCTGPYPAAQVLVTRDGRVWTSVRRDPTGFLIVRTASGQVDPSFNRGQPLEMLMGTGGIVPLALLPAAHRGVVAIFWTPGDYAEYTAEWTAVDVLPDGRPGPMFGGGQAVHYIPRDPVSPDNPPSGDVRAALRLPDGRLRVCANVRTQVPGPSAFREEVWLGGMTTAGTPDMTLGPEGWRVIPGVTECSAAVLHRDGHVLIAGTETGGGRAVVRVTAVTAAGEIVAGWGDAGHVDVGQTTRALKVEPLAMQFARDGHLYVGLASRDVTQGSRWVAAVTRLTANGAVSTGFGFGGVYRYGPTGSSRLTALAVSGSRLYLGLTYASSSGVERLLAGAATTSARLDGGFGRSGLVGLTTSIADIVADSSGRILHVGLGGSGDGTSLLLQRRLP